MSTKNSTIFAALFVFVVLLIPQSANAVGIVSFASDVGPTWSVSSVNDNSAAQGLITVTYFDPANTLAGMGLTPAGPNKWAEAVGFNFGSGATSSIANLWQMTYLGSGPDKFALTALPAFNNFPFLGIDEMFISLLPFNGAWDRTNPNPGTPGSLAGQDFSINMFNGNWDVAITHSGFIQTGMGPASGDLFGALNITFTGNIIGVPGVLGVFDANDVLHFVADTDTFLGTPQAVAVPEPATLALMGLGLAGLGFARSRRTG